MALLRLCITGWLEVDVALNCGMIFSGSGAATAHVGKYPKTACDCFPLLVPWQRKQFSYWLTAGFNTVIPSVALMPITPFCETRITGGKGDANEVDRLRCMWAVAVYTSGMPVVVQ